MDFIPKVKMDFVPDDFDEETGEDNPQFIYDDEEIAEGEKVPSSHSKDEDEDEILEIPIKEQEINPSMNGINEEEIFEDIPKKPKKKRKPMSEEHKQKLKLAREKAMAVKKEKALERKKLKDDEKRIKELKRKETELQRKKAEGKVAELEQSLNKATNDKPLKKERSDEDTITLTKKQIEEAQLTAIMKYEALRKERKKNKNIKKEEEKEKEDMKKVLHRALNPNNRFTNYNNYSGF